MPELQCNLRLHVVPPHTMTHVKFNVDNPNKALYVYDAHHNDKIVMPATLWDTTNTTQPCLPRVLNLSSGFATLKKGRLMGLAYEMDEVVPTDQQSTDDMAEVPTTQTVSDIFVGKSDSDKPTTTYSDSGDSCISSSRSDSDIRTDHLEVKKVSVNSKKCKFKHAIDSNAHEMDDLPEMVEDSDDEDDYDNRGFHEMLPEIKQWRSERDKINSVRDSLKQSLPKHVQDLFQRSNGHLNDEECKVLRDVLNDYQDVFAKNDHDLGHFDKIEHEIPTGDAAPIQMKLRRTPIHFEEDEREELQKMLDADVCEPSVSPWAMCPVLIRKKDGRLRYAIDYRALNSVTVKDAYPLPLLDDCLDTLHGVQWISCLDMNSGYWQVSLAEKDRHKAAFVTRYGLFQPKVMPFGLCSAPQTFSRVMEYVLRGLKWEEVLCYLDDISVIGGADVPGHADSLRKVFQRFRDNNLKLKPKKCSLFQTEVKYLGRIVNREGIRIDDKHIEDAKSWPTPRNVRELQVFLGLMNYHRTFIKDFATLSKKLYPLTSDKNAFEWTEVHQDAFEKLKMAITSTPVLALPSKTGMFVLDTDASYGQIGAELHQIQDGTERLISYGSYSLTPAQRKYCTTRKELLAIVRFCQEYRHYLIGSKFVVRTDHAPLAWLFSFRNPEGQVARWLEFLSSFDMILVHRPGKLHVNADAWSRKPLLEDKCDCYSAGIDVKSLPCYPCHYCDRLARNWSRFDEDTDDVLPLAIKAVHLLDLESETDADQDEIATQPYGENEDDIATQPYGDNEVDINEDATVTQPYDEGNEVEENDVATPPDNEGDENPENDGNPEPVPGFPDIGKLFAGIPDKFNAPLTKEAIREMQGQDEDIRPVIEWIETQTNPRDDDLFLSAEGTKSLWLNKDLLELCDGILYYRWCSDSEPALKLVVPENLRTVIFDMVHNSTMGGHPGIHRTIEKTMLGFYWPNMSAEIEQMVRACVICQRSKKLTRRKRAPLVTYQAGIVMERVHMDICGPLPKTEQGNIYILVLIDQFSKWVELYPISDQTSLTLLQNMVLDFFLHYGVPYQLHSDGGKNVDSNLVKKLAAAFNIAKTRTTPYHPQSNSQVERVMRTIMEIARTMVTQQNQWDEYCKYIAHSIRATPHTITGFTPNKMMFGREINMPEDIFFDCSQMEHNVKPMLPQDWVDTITSRLKAVHQVVRKYMKATQVRNKKYYDLKIHHTPYDLGDVVWVFNAAQKKGVSRKLKDTWLGPRVVTKVVTPVLYQLEDRKGKRKFLHHDMLKKNTSKVFPMWILRIRHRLWEEETDVEMDEYEPEFVPPFIGVRSELQEEPISQETPADVEEVHTEPRFSRTGRQIRKPANLEGYVLD